MTASPGPSEPATPRDLFALSGLEGLFYEATITAAEATGFWRRGRRRAQGDLARMRLLDKVYWVYKTTSPVRRARRGSGLEAYFAARRPADCVLPTGFEPETRITLSTAGDLMHHPALAATGDALYRDVAALLFDVDLAMANLECVVAPPEAGDFDFSPRAGPRLAFSEDEFEVVGGAAHGGFGFVSAACNHSLDFGAAGVDGTIRRLTDAGIAFHGLNVTGGDPSRPTLVERGGVRLALLSHTFGLNAHVPPPDRPDIVNVTDLNAPVEHVDLGPFARQIAACRKAEADFVVAHLHWGLEHELYPTPDQVAVAHRIAEMGVDAIVGHHPHVLQPSELYRTRRDPDRLVPICYSLGNLVNPFSAPWLRHGGVLRLELCAGRHRGERRTYVSAMRVEDVHQSFSGDTISIRPGPPDV